MAVSRQNSFVLSYISSTSSAEGWPGARSRIGRSATFTRDSAGARPTSNSKDVNGFPLTSQLQGVGGGGGGGGEDGDAGGDAGEGGDAGGDGWKW
jgi:hypothetical protein